MLAFPSRTLALIMAAAFVLSLAPMAKAASPLLPEPDSAGGGSPFSVKASNIGPGTTASEIAPRLPSPIDNRDADTHQFLKAARQSLEMGHTGEAQEALERAQTRALDRSVAYDAYRDPIQDPLSNDIAAARRALGNNDLPGAIKAVDRALQAASTPATPSP